MGFPTVHLKDAPLETDETIFTPLESNTLKALIQAGIVNDAGRTITVGTTPCPVVKVLI